MAYIVVAAAGERSAQVVTEALAFLFVGGVAASGFQAAEAFLRAERGPPAPAPALPRAFFFGARRPAGPPWGHRRDRAPI